MSDQDLEIHPGITELSGSFSFDVGHTEWSNEIELFDEPLLIEQISATFDQLGRPMVFYRTNGNVLKLWWFDSQIGQTTTTILGYGTDPTATFDFPININKDFTDALLHYVRKNKLYMRVQRDRFAIEYPVHPNQPETIIYLPFTNDFTDLTGEPWTVTGNVTIVPEGFFGSGAFFNGGWLQSTTSPDWVFGAGDFTLGMRLQPKWTFDGGNVLEFICGNWSGTLGNTGWALFGKSNGAVVFRIGTHLIESASAVLADSTWSMIEVTRASGVLRVFNNGNIVAQLSDVTTDVQITRPVQIAKDLDTNETTPFILDSLFAIKGLAQRTAPYSVPNNPQPLWVNSTTQAFDGLVFAADYRTSQTPWTSSSVWATVGNVTQRFFKETSETYLSTVYRKDLVGLESTGELEQLKLNTARFTIRVRYLKPNYDVVGYNDEVIYSYMSSNKQDGFEIGVIDKTYPYLRSWQSGTATTYISTIQAPIDQDNSISFIKNSGQLTILVNGISGLTTPFTHSYTDNKKASVGYRVYPEPYSTALNPLAGHSRFLGYLAAIEIYTDQAILTNRDYLLHPYARSTSQSNDGLRIISAGARPDYKFQLAYRRLNPDANLANLRYLSKGLEHYALDSTYLKISPENFKLTLQIDHFKHWDVASELLTLFGDKSTIGPKNTISYRSLSGTPIQDEVLGTFTIQLLTGMNSNGLTTVGGRTLTKPIDQTLIVSIGNVVQFVDLNKKFGAGLWEFEFTSGTLNVYLDGEVVGASQTPFPEVDLDLNYGLFFSRNLKSNTFKAANQFVCSEVTLSGVVKDPISNPTKTATEKYVIQNYGELSVLSENLTRLTIVNGDINRWL